MKARFHPAFARLCTGSKTPPGLVLAFLLLLGSANPAGALELRCAATGAVSRGQVVEFSVVGVPDLIHSDQVAELEIVAPGDVTNRVPCFLAQDFETRSVEPGPGRLWCYPVGPETWRARYTLPRPGRYAARAAFHRGRATERSEPVVVECVEAPDQGFIRVSKKDPRFLEFEDGTPFFPMGHNLAFIGSGQYLSLERTDEVLRKMAANGANFARVWVCCEDWALAVEARKSAWGRSWNWRPPFVPDPQPESPARPLCVALGGTNAANASVAPSHPVAVKAQTAYRLAGEFFSEGQGVLEVELRGEKLPGFGEARPGKWTRFEHAFNTGANQWWLGEIRIRAIGGKVLLRNLSLREARGGPELLWEADPNRPARGVYNALDCFYLDRVIEMAARHGIYLQLCLLTRDLYRPHLRQPGAPEYQAAVEDGRKFLRHAVARWGASKHVAVWEYFNENDPNLPSGPFYAALGRYLEEVDLAHRPRTTSAWGPAPRDWAQPELDLAQLHWYLRPVWGALSKDEVGAVLDRAALILATATNKPAFLAEFGLADDKWGLSSDMKRDQRGVHFHNALWASAFSGLAGSAMFWWWEVLDQLDLYHHYRGLSRFVAEIPFNTGGLSPERIETTRGSRVLVWKGRDRVYGWVCDRNATWWNQVIEKRAPSPIVGDSLVIRGLEAGAYRLRWWDTTQGAILAEDRLESQGESLRVHCPAYTGDVALDLVPASRGSLRFRMDSSGGFVFDTGVLQGSLRPRGRGIGLCGVTHLPTGTRLDQSDQGYGLFSHYRVFTRGERYGTGAWDWPATAVLREDGCVQVTWSATTNRPFEMRALYRWAAANTLDLTTTVKATRHLQGFESFLASYFAPVFTNCIIHAAGGLGSLQPPSWLRADPAHGTWQMFPRGDVVRALIQDGRWQLPPHPVDWVLRTPFTRPIAVRRDPATGLCVALMSTDQDCFAVATPHELETHFSVYLSLFGRDLKPGETATAVARLLVLPNFSPAEILNSQRTLSAP